MASAISSYTFSTSQGKLQSVHPDRAAEAALIDANKDHTLSDQEVMDYLQRTDALENPTAQGVDVKKVVQEFQCHLRKEIPGQAEHYHTYEQVGAELSRLEEQYPDLCVKSSLGQTPEGREIWALKISKGARTDDTSQKPGIVITGCHHAREWMSMEAPLFVADQLLENYASDAATKNRVDQGEIWVVPLVNPDGYEFSRTEDNWWRKNRRPVESAEAPSNGNSNAPAVDPAKRTTIGVDLNRNYWDGKPEHFELYRPAGDTPGNTNDDFGWAVSDNPTSDTYRGPAGGSEVEVQDLMKLELGHPNIKAALDHHGYGEMILYPWGSTEQPVDNVATYRDIGTKMNSAMVNQGGPQFRLMPSIELYPTSGTSNDIQHANGLLGYTMEIGQSFQPDESEIDPIRKQVGAANMVFIDEVLARNTAPAPAPPNSGQPAPPSEPAPPNQPTPPSSGG